MGSSCGNGHGPAWVLLSIVVCALASPPQYHDFVAESPSSGAFELVSNDAACLVVDAADHEVVKKALRHLADDIKQVAGKQPVLVNSLNSASSMAVIAGTIGASALIDGLIASAKLSVSDIAGKPESWVIAVVNDPAPHIVRGLVIAGSDRRGTAYGVFDLSEHIGVSPWYWWADLPPDPKPALYVAAGRYVTGPPAVRYRGIFINDEYSLDKWMDVGAFRPIETNPDGESGFGPSFYRKVFELILRLRGNYIWPAMRENHPAFYSFPENKAVADTYAIVMGTSHHEPVGYNNLKEWDAGSMGEWDYTVNADRINEVLAARVEQIAGYENIYTLAMRGAGDAPMLGCDNTDCMVSTTERAIADQRSLLTTFTARSITDIPQIFVPYKEVLGLYNSGLDVPDDVTIVWSDQNFGIPPQFPTASERARAGGNGLYYHISYRGDYQYLWYTETSIGMMWEEMNKAWDRGCRKLWILNVGNLKLQEWATEFFLRHAWSASTMTPDDIFPALRAMAKRDFGESHADSIATVYLTYLQECYAEKPEWIIDYDSSPTYSYSITNFGDEGARLAARTAQLASQCETIGSRLPFSKQAAFFELVRYLVRQTEHLYAYGESNAKNKIALKRLSASSNDYHARAMSALDAMIDDKQEYETMLSGKWNEIVYAKNAGLFDIRKSYLKTFTPSGSPAMGITVEGDTGLVTSRASLPPLDVFSKGFRFIDIFNTGGGSFEWSASTDKNWVTLSETSGNVSTGLRLTVGIDWTKVSEIDDLQTAQITISGTQREVIISLGALKPSSPEKPEEAGFIETAERYISILPHHYAAAVNRGNYRWAAVPYFSNDGAAVTALPADGDTFDIASEMSARAPRLDYPFYARTTGSWEVSLMTLKSSAGRKFGVSIDDAQPVITARKAALNVASAGTHILHLFVSEPGAVCTKILLYPKDAPPRETFMGPPETFFGFQPYNGVKPGVAGNTNPLRKPRIIFSPQCIQIHRIDNTRLHLCAQLFDARGACLYRVRTGGEDKVLIDIRHLPSGMYLLKVGIGSMSITGKCIHVGTR